MVTGSSFWVTDRPQLRLPMLRPRTARRASAFPFTQANVQYVHFARNAIYALARHFDLIGADVLVPAYFHGVEVEALVAAGVKPRFFRVRDRMRVDPADIVAALRPETRAVYVIHYLGFPAPIDEIERICRQRGLLLIEDCALALLSRLGDQPLGSFGDASVFCLYKTLPTPDGGAVVMKEGRLPLDGIAPSALGTARELTGAVLDTMQTRGGGPARLLASAVKGLGKVMARPAWTPVGTQEFDPADARLLMSGMASIVLASQDFEAIVRTRRRNFEHLESLLGDLSEPIFAGMPRGVCPLFYPFATPHKVELWERLQMKGVQSVLFWMPRQFAPPIGTFPEVDTLRQTVLELPCHQDMTSDDVERLARIVRSTLRELGN